MSQPRHSKPDLLELVQEPDDLNFSITNLTVTFFFASHTPEYERWI